MDRAAADRDVEGLIDRARTTPGTRVLAVRRDAAPVADDALVYLAPDAVGEPRAWAFLGRSPDGAAVLVAAFDDPGDDDVDDLDLGPDATWGALRVVGGDLPEADADTLCTAVALAGWLRDASFCPACGSATELRHAGWSRHCPRCGREHFPRTDPAVIVLVTSREHPDRVLLGSNAAWGSGRYSCFAGFAEAGESLEQAAEREVGEESGLRIVDLAYRGSQPWPYPRSLMLGFRAVAVRDDDARPDGEEIVEVRWFTRDEIGAALRGESDVRLPGTSSIARRLIDEWFEESR